MDCPLVFLQSLRLKAIKGYRCTGCLRALKNTWLHGVTDKLKYLDKYLVKLILPCKDLFQNR